METWKKINGYDNYRVSNLGNVKNIKHDKILKPFKSTKGQLTVQLFREGEPKGKQFFVHRLVYFGFKPDTDVNKVVIHKDGDYNNNTLKNLK